MLKKFGSKPFEKFGADVRKREKKIETPIPAKNIGMVDDEPEIMLVQGRPAGSSYEWRVAQALENMKARYQYQYPVQGGRGRRGGQVIDFYVYVPARPVMLDVKGRYWHTGIHDDEIQAYELQALMPWASYLAIWDEQCETIQTAETFLRQHINT